MAKHDALREQLAAALPELVRNPDKLQIYMTGGRLQARYGDNLGFQYKATLQVDVLDFPGEPAQFFMPFLIWLRHHEPAVLLAHDDNALRFEVDLVDNGAVDISIQLPITEAVDVIAREDGSGYDMVIREEPPIVGDDPFQHPPTLLKRIYHDGVLLVGTPPNP